ncbi:glutamate ligase domain-containing protein, partial [Pseudomonas promysalinigenes]|uniref:glutamate ligase domain-containing protein n=1 Tax=Pseudomonas promysalinigenes TaxID=485898 RepID=UPI003F9F02AE
PPERIRAEVRAGIPDCIEIPSRVDAIHAALHMARPGDLVLVAGKGDEDTQIVGTAKVPHDDREILRRALA